MLLSLMNPRQFLSPALYLRRFLLRHGSATISSALPPPLPPFGFNVFFSRRALFEVPIELQIPSIKPEAEDATPKPSTDRTTGKRKLD